MKLSIIVPAHNEENNITDLIRKIAAAIDIPHELIIVNDHSQDNTSDLVKSLSKEFINLRLIENTLEKGFANAIKTGFNNARNEVIIPIMGDLCDDLTTVKKMFEKINAGFDVVCGSRYIKGGARIGGSKFKAFLSNLAGKSLYWLLGIPTHDIANAFKMYKKEVLDKITLQSKGFEISMEIPLKAYYAGFKITEVPTTWNERTKGKSSFKILKLLPNYLKLYTWALYMRLIKSKKFIYILITLVSKL
ncbi:MAG: glycosyltransferase [Candidatus Omnitrophota bacterium]